MQVADRGGRGLEQWGENAQLSLWSDQKAEKSTAGDRGEPPAETAVRASSRQRRRREKKGFFRLHTAIDEINSVPRRSPSPPLCDSTLSCFILIADAACVDTDADQGRALRENIKYAWTFRCKRGVGSPRLWHLFSLSGGVTGASDRTDNLWGRT